MIDTSAGSGHVSITVSQQIDLTNNASIITSSGDITLSANAAGTMSGNFEGIDVESSAIRTDGTGNILLIGKGGRSSSHSHLNGVLLSGTTVSSTASGIDAGKISIRGTGGDGVTNGTGVRMILSPQAVTSVDGDIEITGDGGDGSSLANYGVELLSAGIESTGTSPNAARISIDGTGGGGTLANHGVRLPGAASVITSIAGDLTIIGTGGGSGSSIHYTNVGVYMDVGANVQVETGTLTVDGTATTPNNSGVAFASHGGTIGSVGSGDIIITARGSGPVPDLRYNLGAGNSVTIGDVTHLGAATPATGNITLNVDSIEITGAGNTGIQSAGGLIIRPRTPNTTIGLGGAAGTLNLSDTFLGYLQEGFSSVTIGDTTIGTGTVNIDTVNFTAPVTIAGGTINDVAGTDIAAGANTVTLQGNVAPGQSPGILTVTGNYAFATGSTFEAEIMGRTPGTQHDQIDVTGTVDINNATLNIDDTGFTAVGNETFVLINNDEADAVTGTFSGLAEGSILNVGGQNFAITYAGGTDSNDVVLEPTTVSPPPEPLNVIATDTHTLRPTISWDAEPNATSYGIWFIKLAEGATPSSVVAGLSGLTSLSFTPDADLAEGNYSVWVRSINAAGASTWSIPATFRIGPMVTIPAAPASVTVVDATVARPTIEWTPSADATSYGIWFIDVAGGVVAGESGLTGTSFTPSTDLATGNYRVYVRAFNSAGVSAWSTPLTFFSGTLSAPQPPTDVLVVDPSVARPEIQWTGSAGATSYGIWLIDQAGGVVAGQSGLSGPSFTPDSDLTPGHNYSVYIRAFNLAGVSNWSTPLMFFSGTLSAPQPPTDVLVVDPSVARPEIQWTGSAGATSYGIWFIDQAGGVVAGQSGLSGPSFTPDSDLTPGHNYSVYIRAFNSAGVSN